ncbi:MAG: RNA polymerase sigma factor [bacterium]|nr:RNA polymerase sigma factor [bacterium]
MPYLVPRHSTEAESAALTDSELLAATGRGDQQAFAELVDRKTEPLLHLAFRIVGDREEAKDLVQLAFLRAWEHRERYDPRWSANTWLYRITTNLGIDYIRARSTRRRKTEPVRHHLRAVHSKPEAGFESMMASETLAILRDLASDLSARQSKAFLLREVEGLSSKEVAEVLECSESTVRNHLFAARVKLRRELSRRFPEYAALARDGRR